MNYLSWLVDLVFIIGLTGLCYIGNRLINSAITTPRGALRRTRHYEVLILYALIAITTLVACTVIINS